jgi:hypothetical protein
MEAGMYSRFKRTDEARGAAATVPTRTSMYSILDYY